MTTTTADSPKEKPRSPLPLLLTFVALIGGMVWLVVARGNGLPTTRVQIGEHRVRVEIAATDETRAMGLMHRSEMPENHGMLFVYPSERVLSFWMRNTLIPLSIAYIDEDKEIVRITDMQPLDETSHSSRRPAQYALEVNQGWFAERGITEGDRVEFELPDLEVQEE